MELMIMRKASNTSNLECIIFHYTKKEKIPIFIIKYKFWFAELISEVKSQIFQRFSDFFLLRQIPFSDYFIFLTVRIFLYQTIPFCSHEAKDRDL